MFRRAGVVALGCLMLWSSTTLPTSAAQLGPYSCLGANGLSATNPASSVMNGYVSVPGYKTVYIGTSGNVNWKLDPFNNFSWQEWFHSLLWLDPLVKDFMRTGNAAEKARLQAIITDWAHDNPTTAGGPGWVGQIAGYRATILTCMVNAVGLPSWLAGINVTHGTWLATSSHYAGAWNQGLDMNIGLVGLACKMGRSDWANTAITRMNNDIGKSIDSQGAPNEQAPGYSSYLYERWTLAASKVSECGLSVPAAISSRTSLLASFIAYSTQPDGNEVQIGDTYAAPPSSIPGTPAEYAATQGASGSPPPNLVMLYSYQGYVFARTAWDPFGTASFYSIHFGPGRNYHGHNDHMSVTYMWTGKPVLIDSGHDNYTLDAYRVYLRSPEGHNVLTVNGGTVNPNPTTLKRYTIKPDQQFYEMTDQVYTGVTRDRELLYVDDPGFMVVLDRASAKSTVGFRQLWHLPTGSVLLGLSRATARLRSADGSMQYVVTSVPFPGETLPAGATGVVSGQTSPYLGWVSTKMGSRVKDPVVVMGRIASSVRMLTVVVPSAAGASVSTTMARSGTGWVLNVTINGLTTPVFISGGASMYV
ncbi:MAG TPA: heparinase II/III family protein [Actinomycetota bacterium]|nr:heparinase II/III family protein [Actinomycetota bacterium]